MKIAIALAVEDHASRLGELLNEDGDSDTDSQGSEDNGSDDDDDSHEEENWWLCWKGGNGYPSRKKCGHVILPWVLFWDIS